MNVTFISGNQDKVDFLQKFLGVDINHQKIDLEELQSLDLHEIIDHKVRLAYEHVKSPVLVEDIGLSIDSMGKLPGTLVKWFLQEIGVEGICRLADLSEDRSATAAITYGYYDGQEIKYFDGQVEGSIADKPRGGGGYGWDKIFIPNGSKKTNAEMNDDEVKQYGLRTTTVFPQIKLFIETKLT